ncbi:alpha-L-fucosidase [Limisphaera sp. 4302-co]|uniref:alpha-L-fucosidase n=1 Tax=Limisphaera sp. 4302-co TaxID=3400417 RepID=UPI003C19DC6C
MKASHLPLAAVFGISFALVTPSGFGTEGRDYTRESPEAKARRMAWFEEARFGLFLHWGVYAVPAGEWEGKTHYGEWFLEETRMPVSQYEKFADQFNPVRYDARTWVRLAKAAGMKYIVITSKHHDGFCLWDSAVTDWDIGRTPFGRAGRDPLKELAEACREEGIRLCFYYSIMDWHHPDWGTRRPWNDRASGTPDMDRYVQYMKAQLRELITRYGPLGILWFDGEWESPWTHERGVDLYNHVRSLQPDIIVNNRVGKGRAGMQGMDRGRGVGDYGTPEQEIPATGFGPGVYWESCMTMNDHWGYNKHDQNWKSTRVLIRNLVDCASKGGNYLLNIGPTAEGTFPEPAVQRLQEIGRWMSRNSESIYGTKASPFESLPFGRCTQKPLRSGNTILYLHVFERPADGRLLLPGLVNSPLRARFLADDTPLRARATEAGVVVELPETLPDPDVTVVALEIRGKPRVIKPDPYADETPEQRDARMRWWREARFGMFIHWGVYAVPAGVYKGQRIPRLGEWIMNRAKIPVAEYREFARSFNPVFYDPDAWVRLAKEAGMKYIIITSKHHDGFALFDSQASDWDVVDATPYGRDLLLPLAAACRKHGIKLGFYYSQAQDWVNGGSASGGKWDPAQERDMDDYIRNVAVPQVREILTRYGEFPAVLWWDTPVDMNRERADQLIRLLRLKPGIIHNNRLGGGYRGDTETPEQYIPATGYPDGRDFEVCMTINDTWGYKSWDHNWKSTETLIRNLIDIASKGGNYLLNVGPMADGRIPEPSVQRLKEIGAWMKINGEAIYGTRASPFRRLPWGRCTVKPDGRHTILYLHVFQWPTNGQLVVPGLKNPIQKAWLLADRRARLSIEAGEGTQIIRVPAVAPDPIATVVAARIPGRPEVEPLPFYPEADGRLLLDAMEATLHGSQLRYEPDRTKRCIGFWTDPNEWVSWDVELDRPRRYRIRLSTAAEAEGARLVLRARSARLEVAIPQTGDYTRFRETDAGVLELPAGRFTLEVRPVTQGWRPVNLRFLRLEPAD